MFRQIETIKRRLALASALVISTLKVQAILFYSTPDPSHNTTAPTGVLADSGWQYQGQWGSFSGPPIGPHYFISAQHIGGAIGDVFLWNNLSFTTLNYFDDASSDLRIWQVRETFSSFAPLYTASDEVGKDLVVIGRGTQRGVPVMVDGEIHGWQPGTFDHVQRWGQNVVAGTVMNDQGGEQLMAEFKASGGANEADLSLGDSGGAIYIQDGSTWKLAGINYAVDGNFNTNSIGPGFAADLFDYGGLYSGHEGAWSFQLDLPTPQPSSFYATRISVRNAWISSVLAQALPVDDIKLEVAPALGEQFVEDGNASVDSSSHVITTALPSTPDEFFRITDSTARRIISIQQVSGKLQISYR